MTDRNVFQLAHLADCYSPDSDTSPGAQWLERVASLVDDYEFATMGENDRSDAIHEAADGVVPVYTHEVWSVFVDLGAYREDLDNLGGTSGDMEQDAKISLFLIAERLLSALVEELPTEEEETDDDDE